MTKSWMIVLTLIISLWAIPSHAQDGEQEVPAQIIEGGTAPTPESKPELTVEQKAKLRKTFCYELARHVPDGDVAYKPEEGVSPADISTNAEIEAEDLKIPIKIPLQDYIKNPGAYNVNMNEMFIDAGTLTMKEDRLYLDGKPLGPDYDALAQDCENGSSITVNGKKMGQDKKTFDPTRSSVTIH